MMITRNDPTIEREITFNIVDKDVPRFIQIFGLDYIDPGNGCTYGIHELPQKSGVYVYFESEDEACRDRLIFRNAGKRRVSATWAPKSTTRDTTYKIEYERTKLSAGDAMQLIRESPPIEGALVKTQATWRMYCVHCGAWGAVSIANMEPVNITAMYDTAPVFTHVEFEELSNWDPEEFARSQFFRSTIAFLVEPATKSKREEAAMFGKQRIPGWWSASDLTDAIGSLLRRKSHYLS